MTRILKKVTIDTARFKGRLPVRIKQISTAALLTSSGVHTTVDEAVEILNSPGVEGFQIINDRERNDSSWEAPTF